MEVNYSNVLSQQNSPANNSYSKIIWSGTAVLLWSTQTVTAANQFYAASTIDAAPSASPAIINLPTVTLASTGALFVITNLSSSSITINAFDNTFVANLGAGASLQFQTETNTVTVTEATCWKVTVIGATTNTYTLSSNLGYSLRAVGNPALLQVAQAVTPIPVALPIVSGSYSLGTAQAIQFCATTLINTSTITTQTNIMLGVSSVLYAACGFTCTIVNEAAFPVVLQTDGDTINGVPLQTTTNSASFVLTPGSSCIITSSSLGDWLVTSQSSSYQQVFRTASINLSTANYIGLTNQSSFLDPTTATELTDPLSGAAVAIDMTTNLDLFYSPLWVLNGTIPTDIAAQIAATGGTFWIILPNNLNAVYFVLAQSTTTGVKFGLAANYGGTTPATIALPTLNSSWEASGQTTWAIQYNAQITNAPGTQLSVSLLITQSNGGGGNYPDITDDPTIGLVSITGAAGLLVTRGLFRAPDMELAGKPVAVVIPGTPVLGDIVICGPNRNLGGPANSTADSGVQITTVTPESGSLNTTVPTSLAVYNALVAYITNPLVFKGVWDPATNMPMLADGTGTAGWVYVSDGTATINLGSGNQSFVPGDFVIYDTSAIWVKVARADTVTSVNGQIGAVQLYLQSLLGVNITSPSVGDVLTYSTDPYTSFQTITEGTGPQQTVMFIISTTIFLATTNFGSNNVIISTSAAGGSFSHLQTITVGNGPSGIAYLVVGSTPTLCVANKTDGTVTILKYSAGTFGTPATVTVGTAPMGVCSFTVGSDYFFATANNGSANVSVLQSTGTAFTLSQTVTAALNPYGITSWVNETVTYLGITNNGANSVTILSAASTTFGLFQTLSTDFNQPRGITQLIRGVTNFIFISNYSGSSVAIFNSFDGAPFALYQPVVDVGGGPTGIVGFQTANQDFVATGNNTDGTLTILSATATNQFTVYDAAVAVGTGVLGISYATYNQVNYLASADNTANTATVLSATASWVNLPGGSLASLSDVDITSPANGQVLTYDAATEKWVNQNAANQIASDFNTTSAIGSAYTVLTTDAFKLLAQGTASTIAFPNAAGFSTGSTICIANTVASVISLVGAVGTNTVTMSGNLFPAYYKIESDGANWIISEQRQNLYTPWVNNTSLNAGTLPATLTALNVGALSPVVNASAGQIITSANIVSTGGSNGQFCAIGGSGSTWYNAMLLNDGSNAYLLNSDVQTTQAAAIAAAFNANRPFSWNLINGYVTLTNFASRPAIPSAATSNNAVAVYGDITSLISTNGGGIVAQAFGSTGYVKFSGGFIIQWGTFSGGSSGGETANFAITFPNFCMNAIAIAGQGNLDPYRSILFVNQNQIGVATSSGFPPGYYIVLGA